jgi:hypothetical protein
MRFNICLAALAATLVAATPANAATGTRSATAEARGVVLQPLTLTKVTDLDFGTVAGSNALGTVSVDADSGVRTVSGGVIAVPSSFSRARFDGLGQEGQTYALTLAQPTGNLLYSGSNSIGGTLSLDSGGATRVIGTGGNFTVYVGGDFSIAANQPNGTYTALFTLTADYQ